MPPRHARSKMGHLEGRIATALVSHHHQQSSGAAPAAAAVLAAIGVAPAVVGAEPAF